MGKKLLGVCIAMAAVLVLSARFLPYLFAATEPGEAFPITLVGSDIAYGPVNTDHEHLKLLDLMDPNATEWTAPELTAADLGEEVGTVGWSQEEDLIGCTLYRYAAHPQKYVFVLDDHGTYRLYERSGFFRAPNGTGTPVTEKGGGLSALAILWEGWIIPEDRPGRVLSIDLGSDGARENITLLGPADGWLEELYVTEEQPDGTLTAWRLPTEAFAEALEARLRVEQVEDRTIITLGEKMTNPTALLAEKGFTKVTAVSLENWCFTGGYKAGGFFFAAELQVTAAEGSCTVGTLDACVGYEDGTFTLSDWELSGAPMN